MPMGGCVEQGEMLPDQGIGIEIAEALAVSNGLKQLKQLVVSLFGHSSLAQRRVE